MHLAPIAVRIACSAALAAAALWAGAALAAPKTIELPPDPEPLVASPLPGYAKAQGVCLACHSSEYMRYQPPNAARPYWDAMVKRMKAVFNAPIDEKDMPDIVDYLVKTYGNERPR
ncbi:MAG TPA: cytochrome c [Caldimonas sp.]|nr:cytochrome c [Caldimonas sp.]